MTDKVSHYCLALRDHILTPYEELQETPLGNAHFSLFTDGCYLKCGNGRYCAWYAISVSFDVVEAASLPTATSVQQTELYPLTQACTLDKYKTINIHTDIR